jgi:phage/plasmid-associated DNA primase
MQRKYLNERIVALLIGSPPNDPIRWLTDAIMREHIFATMDDNDDVYRYSQSQGIFLNGGATIVKKQIELLRPNTTTYEVREILNHIRHRTYVSRSDFDSNIDILNTDNCTLNIHILEIRPHSPDYLSLVKIPAHYDPDAKCPLLLQFFNQVLRPEDIPVVLQMIGYCLYKTWIYQKSFMLFGRSGSNGKGVLLSIMEALLGRSNCSHRSLQDLDTNRFAIADLYGKYANIFGDLKSTKLAETATLK